LGFGAAVRAGLEWFEPGELPVTMVIGEVVSLAEQIGFTVASDAGGPREAQVLGS
ncbi:MAG: hypothetical protein HC923_03235, partial [Myxococcales bacterium]|nr:hypothetical protein [Myxococcales bacterium]